MQKHRNIVFSRRGAKAQRNRGRMAFVALLTVCVTVALVDESRGCTAGVAIGNAVADGRPLVWRNFDWHGNVTLYHNSEERYAFLSPSPTRPNFGAGTNEAGLAIYTTLMRGLNPEDVVHLANPAMHWILGNCRTVDDVRRGIEEQIRFEKEVKQLETHLLETTRAVRSHWQQNGFDKTMAQRLTNEAGEMVWHVVRALNEIESRETLIAPRLPTTTLEPHGRQLQASCRESDQNSVVSIRWNFGDGTTANGPNIRHTFDASGVYLVSCTVEGKHGSRSTRWQLIEINR